MINVKSIGPKINNYVSKRIYAISWTKDIRTFVKKTNAELEKNPKADTYNYFFNKSGNKVDYEKLKAQFVFSKNIIKNIKNFYNNYKHNLEIFK